MLCLDRIDPFRDRSTSEVRMLPLPGLVIKARFRFAIRPCSVLPDRVLSPSQTDVLFRRDWLTPYTAEVI